jgi:hypothetical protein
MSSDGGGRSGAPVAIAWRAAAGVGTGVALTVAGLAWPVGVAGGAAVTIGLMASGRRPTRTRTPPRDPFTLSEPWRHDVVAVQRAERRLHHTLGEIDPGPLHDRLESIVERLDHGVEETWRIARRGDQIDDAIRRLDPTALRERRRALLAAEGAAHPEALESIDSQLATVDRLRDRSNSMSGTLRLSAARFDELAARATEIAVGAGDTDSYADDVDGLIVELESLRLAAEETRDP